MANEIKVTKKTEVIKEEMVLTHTALGVHRLSNGEYAVARLRYNPETKTAVLDEVIAKGDRVVAIEHFKISAAKEIL